ncbi:MAG: hypothetical protein ISR61_04360 [Desulfobacteraceae bacterium]|nr:hypothetical protein [Desulfobacteraceae bacterium]
MKEPWILNEVVEWLRHYDCLDYLEATFMYQTGRDRPRGLARFKDFFLIQRIDKLREQHDITVTEACNRLAETWGEETASGEKEWPPKWDDPDKDFPEFLRQKYYGKNKYKEFDKERTKKRKAMPYPYYGRDIE